MSLNIFHKNKYLKYKYLKYKNKYLNIPGGSAASAPKQIIIGTMGGWGKIIPTVDLNEIKPRPLREVFFYENLEKLSMNEFSIATDYQKEACFEAQKIKMNINKPYRYHNQIQKISFNIYPINSAQTMFIMVRGDFSYSYLQIRQKKYIKLPDHMVVQFDEDESNLIMIDGIYYDFKNHRLTRNLDMDGVLNKGIDEEWF
jgi:hypothetical protein